MAALWCGLDRTRPAPASLPALTRKHRAPLETSRPPRHGVGLRGQCEPVSWKRADQGTHSSRRSAVHFLPGLPALVWLVAGPQIARPDRRIESKRSRRLGLLRASTRTDLSCSAAGPVKPDGTEPRHSP